MTKNPGPKTAMGRDLDQEVAKKAREQAPERSHLQNYSGREGRDGFVNQRSEDEVFEGPEDTAPWPADQTDDVAASPVYDETADGLDETEEEIRRQAEDRPLGARD